MTKILDMEEVCAWLGLSRMTVAKLANEGVLPGRLVGGRWRFREDLIMDYLAGKPATDQDETGAPALVDA